MIFQHSGIEHRIFLVGKRIQFTTHLLDAVHDLQGGPLGSPLERNMLAEMRQSFITRLLITGTCRYLIAAVNNR